MPNYKCHPRRNVTCFNPTFQVTVSERLRSMPYARCGFINVLDMESHTIKIFVSYITPIFAVIDNEYIVRIWRGNTATTSRQISNALACIYDDCVYVHIGNRRYIGLCPIVGEGIAVNLDNGVVLDLPYCIEEFLMNFSPTYTKISD